MAADGTNLLKGRWGGIWFSRLRKGASAPGSCGVCGFGLYGISDYFCLALLWTMNCIDFDTTTIRVRLDVFSYKEDGVQMMYAPALDLCGYGTTVEEAKNSFEVVVSEYLRFGLENGTLESDLRSHGWKPRSEMQEFESPDILSIVRSNKQLQNVMRKEGYRKVSRRLSVPVSC